MSDAFFEKLFGDSEPTHLGSGWVSGVLGVFSDCSAWEAHCACIFLLC